MTYYVLVADSLGQWNVFEVTHFWSDNDCISIGRGLMLERSERYGHKEDTDIVQWTNTIYPRNVVKLNSYSYQVENRFVLKTVEGIDEAMKLVEQVKMLSARLEASRADFAMLMKML